MIYLDYNSTAPLSDRVKNFIKTDNYFYNPNSLHKLGKDAHSKLDETTTFIQETFNLKLPIFYFSSATEAINTFIQGLIKKEQDLGRKTSFYAFKTDHPVVTELAHHYGGHFVSVDKNGDFDINALIKSINEDASTVIINITIVNNTTGMIFPEIYLKKLRQTKAIIHIDASQLPGKAPNWQDLPDADIYTFSGHKIGALKSSAFVISKLTVKPLLYGGKQQVVRSGSLDVLSIYSLKLAFMDILDYFDWNYLKKLYDYFCDNLERVSKKIEIIGKGKSLTTIFFIITDIKLNELLIKLDLNNIMVGVGATCSSGINTKNEVLLAMGYSEIEATQGIRLSWGYDLKREDIDHFTKILSKVV